MANCFVLLNDGSHVLLNDGSSKLLMNDDTCDTFVPGSCEVLLNTGDNVLLNDGTSKLLLNDDSCAPAPTPTPSEGGNHGTKTRVKKKLGRQLINDDRGSRSISVSGESVARPILRQLGKSKAKLFIKSLNESKFIPASTFGGTSFSKLRYPTKNESKCKLFFSSAAESWGILHPSMVSHITNMELHKTRKQNKLLGYLKMIEAIDGIEESPIKSFEFNEDTNEPTLIAFTHSSSFVGNVRYNTETQEMRILLNGKAYNFCNVPRRIYEAFQGADSKGAYFNRSIKTQFDC